MTYLPLRYGVLERRFLGISLFLGIAAIITGLVIFAYDGELTPFIVQSTITSYCVAIFLMAVQRGFQLSKDKAIALTALVGAQVFWFAAPALMVIIGSRDWFAERFNYQVSDRNLVLTVAYLTLFALLALLSYQLMKLYLTKRSPAQTRSFQLSTKEIAVIITLLAFIGILPFLVYSDSIGEMISGITTSRAGADKAWNQVAFESGPLQVLGRSSLVATACIALFQALRSKVIINSLAWGILFGFGFLITYLDSGTRTWTALILAPPVLTMMRERLCGRTAKMWVLAGIVLLVIIMLIGQFQLAIRNTGLNAEALSKSDALSLYDNDFFTETAVAVDLVPDKIDYLFQSNTILFLVNPIPRSLWPEKPYPRVIEQYTLGRTGIDEYRDSGISRLPSIVGQHYMSWGVPGIVLIATLIGMFLSWLDNLWGRATSTPLLRLWTAMATVWLFLCFRGLFPGFHWAVLILGTIVLFERRKSRGKRRSRDVAITPYSAKGIVR